MFSLYIPMGEVKVIYSWFCSAQGQQYLRWLCHSYPEKQQCCWFMQ